MRPPGHNQLGSFAMVILLLFALAIYLVVAAPRIDGTVDKVGRLTVEDQGLYGYLIHLLCESSGSPDSPCFRTIAA